jgi:hypothetical protein
MILQQTEWPERCNPGWFSDRIKGESLEKTQTRKFVLDFWVAKGLKWRRRGSGISGRPPRWAVSWRAEIRLENPNREIVYESECFVWAGMVRSLLVVDAGIVRRGGTRRAGSG